MPGLYQASLAERRHGSSYGVHADAYQLSQAALCWYLGALLKPPSLDLAGDPVRELPVNGRG